MNKIIIGLPEENNYEINHFINWYENYKIEINNNPIEEKE